MNISILDALAPESTSKYRPQEYDEYGRISMHDAVFEVALYRLNADMSLMNAPVWERNKILEELER